MPKAFSGIVIGPGGVAAGNIRRKARCQVRRVCVRARGCVVAASSIPVCGARCVRESSASSPLLFPPSSGTGCDRSSSLPNLYLPLPFSFFHLLPHPPPSLSLCQVHVRRAVIAGDMQIVELKGNVSQVRAFARKVTGTGVPNFS